MKKENLKQIFGSYSNAAKAVGYSRSRITLLPECLPERYVDLFRGASIRLGVYRPDLFPCHAFEANDASNPNPSPRPIKKEANA